MPFVALEVGPRLQISEGTVIETIPGDSVEFSVSAIGFPVPNVEFDFSAPIGTKKVNDGVDRNQGGPDVRLIQMRIPEIFANLDVNVSAENELGMDVETLKIIVLGPGSPPLDIQAVPNENRINISWKIPRITNDRLAVRN